MEGKSPPNVEADHKARYAFAAPFCFKKRVLDVACGTGYGGDILLTAQPVEVVQCDNSPEAIAEAKRRQHGGRIMVCLADAMHLPFEPKQFDVCVSFETLEHVESPQAFVRELSRVGVDGGLLILSTPNRRVYSPGTPAGGKPWNPFHVHEFCLDELLTLLEANSYSVAAVYGQHQENLIRAYFWDIVSRCPALSSSLQRLIRLIRGVQPRERAERQAPAPPQSPIIASLRSGKEPKYFIVVARKQSRLGSEEKPWKTRHVNRTLEKESDYKGGGQRSIRTSRILGGATASYAW